MVRNSLQAGCGGVFRDSGGNWLMGFTREIGMCQPNAAELWAIIFGLEIAWNLELLKKIIVESDAALIVDLVTNVDSGNECLMLFRIRNLINLDWQVDFKYIPREANKIADALAKVGISKSDLLVSCPSFL